MRKLIVLFFLATLISCAKSETAEDPSSSSASDKKCGTYNGKQLYLGAQGGCYYYNSNGNKTYVDRSECRC